MRIRAGIIVVFAIGLAAGVLLSFTGVFSFVGSSSANPVPTALPTPQLADEAAYREVNAQDQVISAIYERVSPSVVHITSHVQTFSMFYGTVPEEGTGSGFVYDDAGHIVTNNHVVANATELDVLLPGGVSVPAEIVGVDAYYDLAVIRIDVAPGTLTPLELGDSAALRIGQSVIAIGNPFGLDRTLTTGVISALGRQIRNSNGSVIGQAVQTDAAINPGNSGGPLLDIYGHVVAINTAINSPSGGSVGIGFAVPVDIVKRVIPSLISDGHYLHPSLGIDVAAIGRDIAAPADGPQQGLLVIKLNSGSVAQHVGLEAAQISVRRGRYVVTGGDIITAIDDHPLKERNDLQLVLEENYRPGDEVTLTVWRGGQSNNLRVTLDAQ